MVHQQQSLAAVALSLLIVLSGCSAILPGGPSEAQTPESTIETPADATSPQKSETGPTAQEIVEQVKESQEVEETYRIKINSTVKNPNSGELLFYRAVSGKVDRTNRTQVAARYESTTVPTPDGNEITATEYFERGFMYAENESYSPATPTGEGADNPENITTERQKRPVERNGQWVKINRREPYRANDTRLSGLHTILVANAERAEITGQPDKSTATVRITVQNRSTMQRNTVVAGPMFVATPESPTVITYTIDLSNNTIRSVQMHGEALVGGAYAATGNKTVSIDLTYGEVEVEAPTV